MAVAPYSLLMWLSIVLALETKKCRAIALATKCVVLCQHEFLTLMLTCSSLTFL